jgi:hypothetical protein
MHFVIQEVVAIDGKARANNYVSDDVEVVGGARVPPSFLKLTAPEARQHVVHSSGRARTSARAALVPRHDVRHTSGPLRGMCWWCFLVKDKRTRLRARRH